MIKMIATKMITGDGKSEIQVKTAQSSLLDNAGYDLIAAIHVRKGRRICDGADKKNKIGK